jgi:2-keto-4-pentenoate hydratase
MNKNATAQAVAVFVAARRTGEWIEALADAAKPADLAHAHAIQDATVEALGDATAGWKVAIGSGEVMRGVILRSRVLQSPAVLEAKLVPLLGIEAEIAFQFDHALPPRADAYSRAEIEAAVTAVAGIEIVASRFRNYKETPLLDRAADCMSNGAFVVGTRRTDWRSIDLSQLEAVVTINGAVVVRKTGGHPTKDPIIPAIALVNALRGSTGVQAGQFITTGTYTGLHFAHPGDEVQVNFSAFGSAEIRLPA